MGTGCTSICNVPDKFGKITKGWYLKKDKICIVCHIVVKKNQWINGKRKLCPCCKSPLRSNARSKLARMYKADVTIEKKVLQVIKIGEYKTMRIKSLMKKHIMIGSRAFNLVDLALITKKQWLAKNFPRQPISIFYRAKLLVNDVKRS